MTGLSSSRRAAQIGLTALLAMAALAPAAHGQVVPTSSTPLPGSTFQGGDGDQDDGGGYIDWQALQAGGRPVHNPDPNDHDTAFVSGLKEQEPYTWDFTTEDGGVSPAKANILDAWSAVDQPGADTFLYLAFTRATGNGDTFVAFELNRDGRLWDNGRAKIPCRRTGDLLVVVEAHGNGNGVDVLLERWRTTEADPATGCARRGELTRATGVDPNSEQGAVNLGPIASRLPGSYAPGSTIAGARVFGEVALNLSKLVDADFHDPCLAFGSIWMHSRSSDSVSANLQDYLAPRPLIVRSCAASGTKFFDLNADGVRDPGEPGVPGFFVFADYDGNGVHDADEPLTETDEDGHYILDDIRPPNGTYTLREATLQQLRRRATDTAWRCSFPHAGTPGGFGDGRGGLFGCGWGPIDAAATPFAQDRDFGDWVPAQLTVRKQLFPSGDPGRFDLIVNGVTVVSAAGDGDSRTAAVRPGTYSFSEAAVAPTDAADYTSSVTCRTTPRARGRTRTGTAFTDLVVHAGDQVTCTFYNVRDGVPAIAIVKTGPALATAGDTLHYTFAVTIPPGGTLPLPAASVKVTDPDCDRAPKLVGKADANGGDGTPGTLDPGDTWTYECDRGTAAPGADCVLSVVSNTATASGSAGGTTVSDESTIATTLNCPDVPPDPPLPPQPEPGPGPPAPQPAPGPPPRPIMPPLPTPPDAGSAGVAGITATGSCVRRVSQVRLTGRLMHILDVRVGGRRISRRTVGLVQRRATPLHRRLAPGPHRLAVRVSFRRGAATPAVTLKRTIVVCAARRPRVTG